MNQNKSFGAFMKSLQIFSVAMIPAPIGFSLVSFFIPFPQTQNPDPSLDQMLLLAFGGASLVLIASSFILPSFFLNSMHKQDLLGKLQTIFKAKAIPMALIEGAGLLWPVMTILTGEKLYLIGAGVCVLLMLLRFPTQGQIEELIGMRAKDIDAQLAKPVTP